jgi:hypothetical protein
MKDGHKKYMDSSRAIEHKQVLSQMLKKQRRNESFNERMVASFQTPECKAKQSSASKKRMEDSEYKARCLEGIKKAQSTDEYKQSKADLCRKRNETMNHTPEHSARMRVVLMRLGGPQRLTCARWHKNRNIVKPDCQFCQQQAA